MNGSAGTRVAISRSVRNPGKFKLIKRQTCISEGPCEPPDLKAIERLKIQCTKYCRSGISFRKLANRGLELIIVAHVTSSQAAAITPNLWRCFKLTVLLSKTASKPRRTSGPASTRTPRFPLHSLVRPEPRYVIYND